MSIEWLSMLDLELVPAIAMMFTTKMQYEQSKLTRQRSLGADWSPPICPASVPRRSRGESSLFMLHVCIALNVTQAFSFPYAGL